MSATIARVRALLYVALHPKRLLALIAGAMGFVVYVWVAAVRAVPGVKERKVAARRAWRLRERKRP
jgi:hypothetical protein